MTTRAQVAGGYGRNLLEARGLCEQVISILNGGHLEQAIWRLADAAGLIIETLPKPERQDLIGWEEFTGRGYRVDRRP